MAPKSGMVAVMHYFGIPTNEFRAEWGQLSDQDKADIKNGIGTFDTDTRTVSGSLTY